MMTLAEMFEMVKTKSRETVERTGQHAPLFLAQPERGDIVPIPVPWRNDEEKEASVKLLKVAFKRLGIRRVVFVMEAWTARTVDQEETKRIIAGDPAVQRPRERSDRQWVIYIVGESIVPGEQNLCGHWTVDGDEKNPKIGKWVTLNGPGSGLLADFITPAAVS